MAGAGAALLAIAPAIGCDEDDAPPAPETDPLEAPEPPPSSRTFAIDSARTKVEFLMEAPLENIHGVADRSMEGDLYVDLDDLVASRGLIKIDLSTLEIFQRTRESADDELGEDSSSDGSEVDGVDDTVDIDGSGTETGTETESTTDTTETTTGDPTFEMLCLDGCTHFLECAAAEFDELYEDVAACESACIALYADCTKADCPYRTANRPRNS